MDSRRVMNGQFNFEQYKALLPEERELFMFTRLCRIDDICDTLENDRRKYAAKWVEHAVSALIALTASGLVGLGFTTLGNHLAHAATTLSPGG